MVSKSYILKRTGVAAFSFWAVVTLSFSIIRLMPGGPVESLVLQMRRNNPDMSAAEIEQRVAVLTNIHTEKPLHEQYVDYMFGLLQGDLGVTVIGRDPVAAIIADALPWTIFLSALSLTLMVGVGVIAGAVMAYFEGGKFDTSMTVSSLVVSSIPYYILAVLLVWILGYQMEVFPTNGRVDSSIDAGVNLAYMGSIFRHATLPVASLVLAGFGLRALSMRGNCIRLLGEDFIRVARLRGLSERRIALRYVGRNAILPMYTGIMVSIGTLFSGSVILEQIFVYPGIGYRMFQAVIQRDYTLMMGTFVFITAGVIVGIFLADLTYGLVDPRAGSDDTREAYATKLTSFSLSGLTAAVRELPRTLSELLSRSGQSVGAGASDEGTSEGRDEMANGGFYRTDFGAPDGSAYDSVSVGTKVKRTADTWVLTPLRVLSSDWRAVAGLTIIGIYLLAGTLGVWIVEPPRAFDGPRLLGPFQSWEFPLGTTDEGKGILGSLIHATPAMLKMMTSGAVFGTFMAAFWGTFSGFVGGRVDRTMMTIADVLMTIPGLPLVIVLAATIQPEDPFVVGIILVINGWAGAARSLRSQVLTIREESYVESSRLMGISTLRILAYDIIPPLMPLILVGFVMRARNVIFSSVGLYFLGILPFTTFNWGVMLNFAYNSAGALHSVSAWHWFIFPMLTIMVITVGLMLLNQGFDRLFNPRIIARHSETAPDTDEYEA